MSDWKVGEWFEWEMPSDTWWNEKERKFTVLRSACPNVVIVKFREADEWESAVYSITAYPSGAAIKGALESSPLGLDGCRKFCGALLGFALDWSKSPRQIFSDAANLGDAELWFFVSLLKGKRATPKEVDEFRTKQLEKAGVGYEQYEKEQKQRMREARP